MGYYHVGLTKESRPKSVFVVPMGKRQFKRAPSGLSQVLAYFQLLIDKVLMGCSEFAMGYLDDIIIFSCTEEEHLQHLEMIFRWLQEYGLKVKWEKCAFFKRHIQYLGHLVSEKGFEPLPEKLESIRKMPAPTTAKEVKQFLGLIGYYRKFIPRFSDISRPLMKLTFHNVTFEWTEQCQKSFSHLRDLLMQYPILCYLDLTRGYILYTDASGIGWSGILMQEYADDKKRMKQHPICYVSGQFRSSQFNWAALTKEVYAIYMSIRRLSFYVTDADVLIRSDHLPLKKSLTKQTMNTKVNNWALELEQFRLKLDWISGSKNLLANSLSHLIDMVPDAKQPDKPDGQEFGNYCLEDLKPVDILEATVVEVIGLEESLLQGLTGEGVEHSTQLAEIPEMKVETVENGGAQTERGECVKHSTPSNLGNAKKAIKITEHEDVKTVRLPLRPKQLQLLQQNDEYCRDVAKKLDKDIDLKHIFIKENGILYRLWTEDGRTFKCILVSLVLQHPMIILTHDHSGHSKG